MDLVSYRPSPLGISFSCDDPETAPTLSASWFDLWLLDLRLQSGRDRLVEGAGSWLLLVALLGDAGVALATRSASFVFNSWRSFDCCSSAALACVIAASDSTSAETTAAIRSRLSMASLWVMRFEEQGHGSFASRPREVGIEANWVRILETVSRGRPC
jgi:hypothetical protein